MYDRLKVKTKANEEETTAPLQIAIACTILALFSLCPFLFLAIGLINRTKLDEAKIKAKVGTLYTGLQAKKDRVISYSITFLVRRSLFIAITFVLFA